MSLDSGHTIYMQRCLQLAAYGLGQVAPNPMVGSVLVYHNRIIGEGYHQSFGQAHAEINCLNSVREEDRNYISDSILYVSLEPCCHSGKTPPCTSAILKHQIKKVVIACRDPFALVQGKGIQLLRDAGVEVMEGVLEKEAIELNKRFICFHEQKRPYILLKWAESADGFIGKQNQEIQISNTFSKQLVHQWRSEEAAIWVGYLTAQIDNPRLNVRLTEGKNPIRIVYDRDLSLASDLFLFDRQQTTLHFHSLETKKQDRLYIKPETWLQDILSELYQLGVSSVMIEGGQKLLQQCIDLGFWDEARVFTAHSYIQDGIRAPQLHNHQVVEEKKIMDNMLLVYRRRY